MSRLCRGDEKWDVNDTIIYYATLDSGNTPNPIVNITLNLYTSAYPYTTANEFDTALGDHDGFLVVGRYIFAQRTDDNVIGLYVSDKRQPFKKAKIPTPYSHQRCGTNIRQSTYIHVFVTLHAHVSEGNNN